MRTVLRLTILGLILVSTFGESLTAQNEKFFNSKKEFLKTIENKFRTNVPEFLEFHLAHPDVKRSKQEQSSIKAQLRNLDVGVNETPEAESELHAAINPADTNNIIVAAMRNNPTNLLAPLSFPIYYTRDFGDTWEVSEFDGVPTGGLLAGGGDPVLVFDSNGRAHLTYLTVMLSFPAFETEMALRYAYSDDGGATWTESDELIDTGKIDALNPENSERLVDKEWLAIDRNQDSPYFDDIYMQYVSFEPDTLENINAKILMKKKKAGEDQFSDEIIQINTQEYILLQYSSIAVDSKGHIHAFFMGVTPDETTSFYHSVSKDGGATFSPENKISDFHLPGMALDAPNNTIPGVDSTRIYPCPHMRVDRSGGDTDGFLYAVWTADGITEAATEGVDIYYTKSTDGGMTWTTPRILNDNLDTESHQFFPSLQVNDRGVVIATWYDRRDDTEGLNTHYYITYSYDGGETFESNFAVSTEPSDFEMIGEKNGGFGIGEYTQVIATSEYAIPVWSDGRDNDGNIDLYIAFIPIYDEVLGIEQVKTLSPDFTITGPAPNPVKDLATLKLNLEKAAEVSFEIHSLDGKLIQHIPAQNFPAGESVHPLSTQHLSSGMYTLSVRSELGFVSKRFVVRWLSFDTGCFVNKACIRCSTLFSGLLLWGNSLFFMSFLFIAFAKWNTNVVPQKERRSFTFSVSSFR